jgi:cell division cycle 14
MKLGWFDFKKFNVTEYDHYEKVENGDLNWIIPNKFVAFSSPSDKKKDENGLQYFTPKDFIAIFKKLGVEGVIRLNTVTYNKD